MRIRMKKLIFKVGPLVLAFLLGISIKALWDERQRIVDFLDNLLLYYQD